MAMKTITNIGLSLAAVLAVSSEFLLMDDEFRHHYTRGAGQSRKALASS